MKKIILAIIVIFELIFAVYLFFKIYSLYNHKNKILGIASVNVIKKDNLEFTSKDLKYFYEPKPNSIDNVNEQARFNATYTINSDALNERFNYSPEKSQNSYRILTLGDSFTYGLYVDTKDNWTELLEERLNQLKCSDISKFEVINLGVHGYDLEYSLERFKKRGIKYKPDVIIWYIIDFMRIDEKMLPLLDIYNKNLKDNSQLEQEIKNGNYNIAWETAKKQSIIDFNNENLKDYQKNILLNIYNYFSGKIIFMMLPNIKDNYKNFIIDSVKSRNNTYIFDNMTDFFKLGGFTFPNDGHPNQKGHQIISNDVYNFLLKNEILPCKSKN